jgi:hypothetical protein
MKQKEPLGMMNQPCNPSTQETETEGSPVPGQPGLQRKILSQKTMEEGWLRNQEALSSNPSTAKKVKQDDPSQKKPKTRKQEETRVVL